jgi:hypothetical protein
VQLKIKSSFGFKNLCWLLCLKLKSHFTGLFLLGLLSVIKLSLKTLGLFGRKLVAFNFYFSRSDG